MTIQTQGTAIEVRRDPRTGRPSKTAKGCGRLAAA